MKNITLHTNKKTPFLKEIIDYLPTRIRKRLPLQMSIISISSQKSRHLNHQYRKKDRPTNVLSFFYGPEYGEILVCSPMIRIEARRERQSYDYRMTWMILHGMLHLTGLDHEASATIAKRVDRLEQYILKELFRYTRASEKTEVK